MKPADDYRAARRNTGRGARAKHERDVWEEVALAHLIHRSAGSSRRVLMIEKRTRHEAYQRLKFGNYRNEQIVFQTLTDGLPISGHLRRC